MSLGECCLLSSITMNRKYLFSQNIISCFVQFCLSWAIKGAIIVKDVFSNKEDALFIFIISAMVDFEMPI